MRSWRKVVLSWTADLEDDLGHPGARPIFVPSIMGAGILASVAVLVADAVRGLNPRRRVARRRAVVRRRALDLVLPLAEAIGVPPPSLALPRRRLRSRSFYAALSIVSTALSVYVAVGSTANYLRAGGYVEGVVWLEVCALSASVFFLAVGVIALAIALRHPVPPAWTRAVIDHSPLGMLEE
ncbi:MAG TPA: hypothetical protein VG078_03740 [Acidimicrobiales bacterium]|nr:hypothetical protein [Acidimicrobiales bacterium]